MKPLDVLMTFWDISSTVCGDKTRYFWWYILWFFMTSLCRQNRVSQGTARFGSWPELSGFSALNPTKTKKRPLKSENKKKFKVGIHGLLQIKTPDVGQHFYNITLIYSNVWLIVGGLTWFISFNCASVVTDLQSCCKSPYISHDKTIFNQYSASND